jgi:8-oxo-dGTP pyrophosphatase MutT (NUDIX family)
MSKNSICNNCGRQGHLFHQCKLPVTSYGIIVFRSSTEGIQYLMLRRKNSFGYIDFIRGKYVTNNLEHLQNLFNEMSIQEREEVRSNNFETLWKNMWGDTHLGSQYKGEEIASQKKFESLKVSEPSMLDLLIENATSKWKETEWEFPKGRRNYQEKDLECALREFEEETGISKKDIIIIENVIPFEEVFIGSNHKSYKHKYFLAYSNKSNDLLNNFQKTEVSKLEWKTLEECLEAIRPYNLEKKQLIININKVLEEYRLY